MVLETPARPGQSGSQPHASRQAALVVRVSTDRQAMNPEGSLTTQLQRLRQHIDYKRSVAGEDWSDVVVYELKAVSGKNSLRSPEFQQLFAEIRSGRVNTVLCTALDRICRSVVDFLHFFEVLNEHAVEFVCLKENYDTTTPQGRLFVTMMMALAQFEREQTAERTRDSTAARADRGLWNGGRLLGYDLDSDNKGRLIPNANEVALINFAFDSLDRIQQLATQEGLLDRIVAETDRRMARQKPALLTRRRVLEKGLAEVRTQAASCSWTGQLWRLTMGVPSSPTS